MIFADMTGDHGFIRSLQDDLICALETLSFRVCRWRPRAIVAVTCVQAVVESGDYIEA